MTEDEFWSLIETSSAEGADELSASLKARLSALQPDQIIEFQKHLYERMVESYRWDLWAIAYIVNGGCSDDGFDYFRGWLIAQGRDYFEAALENPERAADKAELDKLYENGGILSAAYHAYEELTGPGASSFEN
jgi:hypothetical protein